MFAGVNWLAVVVCVVVGTTSAANAAFADRGWTVWGIEAGNHLVTLLLMGLVLTLMP